MGTWTTSPPSPVLEIRWLQGLLRPRCVAAHCNSFWHILLVNTSQNVNPASRGGKMCFLVGKCASWWEKVQIHIAKSKWPQGGKKLDTFIICYRVLVSNAFAYILFSHLPKQFSEVSSTGIIIRFFTEEQMKYSETERFSVDHKCWKWWELKCILKAYNKEMLLWSKEGFQQFDPGRLVICLISYLLWIGTMEGWMFF